MSRASLSRPTWSYLTAAIATGGLAAVVVAVPGAAAEARPTATIPTPKSCYTYTPPVPGIPAITSLKVSPTSVNVKRGGKRITLTVQAKDTGPNAKNITRIAGQLTSPKVGKSYRSAQVDFRRTAGTAKNGTWKGTATIPRWTNNGTWKINGLSVIDAGYGTAYYSTTPGGKWGSSWPRSIKVTSTPDVTAPKITKITLSKKSVSTAKKSAAIKVTVKTSDARSGAQVAYVSGYYYSKTESRSAYAFLKRAGGTTKKATFTGTLTVPRWLGSTKRTWSLNASVSDAMFNGRSYSTKQLKAKKLKSSFTVTSSSDKTKPTLATASFTPKSINVKSAAKSVSVTAKVKDTLSGVSSVYAYFSASTGYGSYGGTLKKTGGSAGNGTWTGKIAFPKCTPSSGTYRLSLSVTDAAGNYSTFTADNLAARGIPVNLSVTSNDSTSPSASSPTGKVPTAGGVVLTFSEPTLWTGSASSLLRIQGGTSYTEPAGTWTCRNAAGTVVTCDANGANVKTVSFTPTTPFDAGSYYYVTARATYPNPTGIYDTSGNPLSYLSTYFST